MGSMELHVPDVLLCVLWCMPWSQCNLSVMRYAGKAHPLVDIRYRCIEMDPERCVAEFPHILKEC